jgi:sulfate permease, SulP family
MALSTWPPGVVALRGYQRKWLRGDLIAGVTVAAYLIPQVMAYAGVARLPPAAGLWAAIPPLAVYALLGSSRLVSMGPEATAALMTATAIGPLAAGDPARYAALAAALALLTGALAAAAWLLRLGFLADLLSRPVLVGYLAGVGLIMAAGQVGRLTGVPVSGESFGPQVWSFVRQAGHARAGDTVISVVVIAFLFTAAARWKWLPGPLVAVLGATAVSAAFALGRHGVALTGALPAGLPAPSLPAVSWHDMRNLVAPAAGILTVSFSEVVLTGRAFEHGAGGQANANSELLALSGCNASAGLLHGFPVSSSVSRSAIAAAAGARTQVFSLTSLVVLLAALLAARPLLAAIPDAALAGIVIYAAVRLVDVMAFRRLAAFRRSEVVLALVACAGVLGFGILYGVLAAVALSVAELVRRVSRPHGAILGLVPGVAGMHDIGDYPAAVTVPGLVVYRYDAPLFFANSQDFRRRALAAAAQAVLPEPGAARPHDEGERPDPAASSPGQQPRGQARWFVLNAEANIEADYTALEAVDAVRAELVNRGTIFALAHVKAELLDDLRNFGLLVKIGEDRVFPTLPTAVTAYRDWSAQGGGG